MAVGDAPLGEIVGGDLDRDLVADGYLDEELAHLARDVGEDFMTVLETDGVHRGRQNLNNGSGHFNSFVVCACHQVICVEFNWLGRLDSNQRPID